MQKKERSGVLEDLASNFFNYKSSSESQINTSRIKSKNILPSPIEINQVRVKVPDEALTGSLFRSGSNTARNPNFNDLIKFGGRALKEHYLTEDINILPSKKSGKSANKEDKIIRTETKYSDEKRLRLSEIFHKRSSTDNHLLTSTQNHPITNTRSTMTTTLLNENLKFNTARPHKKVKTNSFRQLLFPSLGS